MVESAKDFYTSVINEVIEKNRQQFISEGVSEDVLENMKKNWIDKLNKKLQPEQDPRTPDYAMHGMYRGDGHYPHF